MLKAPAYKMDYCADFEQLDGFLYSFSEYAPKNYSKIAFALFSVAVIVACAVSAVRRANKKYGPNQ